MSQIADEFARELMVVCWEELRFKPNGFTVEEGNKITANLFDRYKTEFLDRILTKLRTRETKGEYCVEGGAELEEIITLISEMEV